MKYLLAVLAAALLGLSSCKIQSPEFRGVENVRLEKAGMMGVKFASEAVFYNPNKIKCRITDIAMDVMLDKMNVGTIGEKSDVEINKHSDFRLPLGAMINPKGTIFDGVIKIVEIFRDKESTLTLQGKVIVKAYGFTIPIPVKYEQKVKLSQLKAG